MSSLHHVIDLEWMQEAYRLTRKDGAPGIDGVTAAEYEANLEANLLDLLERIKSGRYNAPPVRRVYIPKADGSQRPLGIPTFEDKVAQRAIVMVLEADLRAGLPVLLVRLPAGTVGASGLECIASAFMGRQGLRWVLDVDISKYYDTIQHHHLRAFLDRRVTDGVIRRMIDKWLKAGVLEHGLLQHTTEGTPQGGVVSPVLANIYLHHVLDEWFELDVRPRLKGNSILVRYADDSVMAFEDSRRCQAGHARAGQAASAVRAHAPSRQDAPRRLSLSSAGGRSHPDTGGTTFDFLGFTHIWGKSRKGLNGVRQVTVKSRYARALAAVSDWCRRNRHLSLARPACASVPDDARPLCLLRHIGQLSTHTMVRLSGREGLEEMAVASGSQGVFHGAVSMRSSSDTHFRQPGSSIACTLPRAKLSREEPDAGNRHVRVCEGWGWQHPHLLGNPTDHAGAEIFLDAVDRVGAEVRMNRALNCWPCVRSLTHSPEAVTHSPGEITAAWPTVVTSSRWPRALRRKTQNPFSAL